MAPEMPVKTDHQQSPHPGPPAPPGFTQSRQHHSPLSLSPKRCRDARGPTNSHRLPRCAYLSLLVLLCNALGTTAHQRLVAQALQGFREALLRGHGTTPDLAAKTGHERLAEHLRGMGNQTMNGPWPWTVSSSWLRVAAPANPISDRLPFSSPHRAGANVRFREDSSRPGRPSRVHLSRWRTPGCIQFRRASRVLQRAAVEWSVSRPTWRAIVLRLLQRTHRFSACPGLRPSSVGRPW